MGAPRQAAVDVNRPFFHPCFRHISPLPAQLPVGTAPQMPNCRLTAFSVPGRVRAVRVLALVLLLSGCSTTDIDRIPQELGGLPAGTPARPAEAPQYPAVHEMPPQRTTSLLDADQQKRLEADLIATRNRQPNQQKNIAKAKAKAEKDAKSKEKKKNKDMAKPKGQRKVRQPPGGQASGPVGAGQTAASPAAGIPPWPLPPPPTGTSQRP